MTTLTVYVDFNEMVEPDLVLLSRADSKVDIRGNEIFFTEGMRLTVYMDDLDQYGRVDNLMASGVAIRNTSSGWSASAKWCCRIDANGIRPQSEISK